MKIKEFLSILIIFLIFIGCGGGDSSSKEELISQKIQLSDDWLDNAKVSDSTNQVATYKGRGLYTFKKEPQGEISLSGGTFENTNIPNKMTMKVDANSDIISPIASFLYEYPHLKDDILSAVKAKDIDYRKTKNQELFRTSKVVYTMASNDLLEEFSNSLIDVKNYNDIVRSARSASKYSPRANTINAYLSLITLSFFNVDDFSYTPEMTKDVELMLTSTTPKDGDVNVAVNSSFNVTFNKPIKSDSGDKITLKQSLTGDIIAITTSVNNDFIKITPTNNLKFDTKYTLSIDSTVQSTDNKILNTSHSISFTTSSYVDNTKPEVKNTVPVNNATLPYGEKVSITFSEAIDKSTLKSNIIIDKIVAGAPKQTLNNLVFTLLDENKKVKIDNLLNASSTYELKIKTGITDLAGNTLKEDKTIAFKVGKDTQAPTISESQGIETGTTAYTLLDTSKTFKADGESIKIFFSEDIDKTSIEGKNLVYVLDSSGDKVNIAASCTSANCTTAGRLANDKRVYEIGLKLKDGDYTLVVKKGVKDLAGNSLANDYTKDFTVKATTVVANPLTLGIFKESGGALQDDDSMSIGEGIILKFNQKVRLQNGDVTLTDATSSSSVKIQYNPGLDLSSKEYKLSFISKKGNGYILTIKKDIDSKSLGANDKIINFQVLKPTPLTVKAIDWTSGDLCTKETGGNNCYYNVGQRPMKVPGAIDLAFNKEVDLEKKHVTIKRVNDGQAISFDLSNSNKKVWQIRNIPLTKGENYQLTIKSDIGSESLGSDKTIDFQTVPKTKVSSLTGQKRNQSGVLEDVTMNEGNSNSGFDINGTFKITFSEDLQKGTLEKNVKISVPSLNGSTSTYGISIASYDSKSKEYSFTIVALAGVQASSFTVSVPKTVLDKDKEGIDKDYTYIVQ